MNASAYIRAVLTVAGRECRVEWRTRETVVATIMFTLLVVAVFAFALDAPLVTARTVSPGLFWATVLLGSIFAFNRLFASERDAGTLDGLLLVPVDPSALFVGKLLGAVVFLLAMCVVALPAFVILIGSPPLAFSLLLVVLLGAVGLAALGSLFGAVAVRARARDVLLPVLFLPAAIPLAITAVGATRLLADGLPIVSALLILALCDLLYVTVGALLFGLAFED